MPLPQKCDETLAGQEPSPAGFGLYVHWPFCLKKCPYCDFNSHVRAQVDQARWKSALLRELAHFRALTGSAEITSVFFGGGTPSLMPEKTVAAVIDAAATLFSVAHNAEITLEANPTSVEAGKFRGFRAAGVNRLSLGVQSLRDDELKFLGREHSAQDALDALETAASIFDRFSFDLIYARPGQTETGWEDELTQALQYAGGHLSLYQLTIEPGTQFETLHRRGALAIPDDDTGARLFQLTQDMMQDAGLPAYEISNHARPGQESRHNLTYWRYGDYIGIGPGAHGRISADGKKCATRTHRAPEIWLERVEKDGHALQTQEELPPRTQAMEMALMGLRLKEGLDLARLSALADILDRAVVDDYIGLGLLERRAERLAATDKGWPVLEHILQKILR